MRTVTDGSDEENIFDGNDELHVFDGFLFFSLAFHFLNKIGKNLVFFNRGKNMGIILEINDNFIYTSDIRN